jgi:hypothetical protein
MCGPRAFYDHDGMTTQYEVAYWKSSVTWGSSR